jgi:hypothetical protein
LHAGEVTLHLPPHIINLPTADSVSSELATSTDKPKRRRGRGRPRRYPPDENGKPIHFNADGNRTAEKLKYNNVNRTLRSNKHRTRKQEECSDDDAKYTLGQDDETEDDDTCIPDGSSPASIVGRRGKQPHPDDTSMKRIQSTLKD